MEMIKYHKEIGFNPQDRQALKALCNRLNLRPFKVTRHAINQIKDKGLPIESIGLFLKDFSIKFDDVFEYKKFNEKSNICQIGIRVKFDNMNDLIFILSDSKDIITLWFNKTDDKHFTLNKKEYSIPLTN